MKTLRHTFSARLRGIRAQRALTQESLAERLGMSHAGYAKIERGETDVSLSQVEQIAQALGVGVPALLGLEGHPAPVPPGLAEEQLLNRLAHLEGEVEMLKRLLAEMPH